MSDTNFVDGQTPIVAAWLNDVNALTYESGGLPGRLTTLESKSNLSYPVQSLYAAGITITAVTQTVSYLGQAYAPILSALPFTTSGTFEAANFQLIQGVAAVGGTLTSANIVTNSSLGILADFTNVPNGSNVNGLVPQIGTPISLGGPGTMTVQNGYAIPTAPSPNLNYVNINSPSGTVITELTIEQSWSGPASSTQNSNTIAFGKNASAAMNVLHLQYNLVAFNLMARISGSTYDFILSGAWSHKMLTDGTEYRIKMASGGDSVVVYGPFGEVFTIQDPRLQAMLGNTAFFEPGISADGSFPKVKRFYGTVKSVANVPAPFALPEDVPSLIGFSNSLGTGAMNANSPGQVSFLPGALGRPTITFGPLVILGRILAPIAAGANTFQSDIFVPDGTTLAFDFASASGANLETVTTQSHNGASAPYTTTITGTFAKNHNTDIAGIPALLITTSSQPQSAIQVNQFGQLVLPAQVIAPDRLAIGSDGYSSCLQQSSTNYAKLLDLGQGKPTSFGVTGGFRVAEGTNCRQGVAVLVGGTLVVSTTTVTANSRIFLTSNTDGGTVGFLRVSARVAGASFTITSSSATDTSTVAYEIFEPA